MKQNAITIYVTKQNKIYLPKAITRFLFDRYPDLKCDLKFLHMKTFTDNRDDWDPTKQRSRIGDVVAVYTGTEFMERIAKYSEDFVFHLSKRWRITIKGGKRDSDADPPSSGLNHSSAQFSTNFARNLMANLSTEAAKEAATRSPPTNKN